MLNKRIAGFKISGQKILIFIYTAVLIIGIAHSYGKAGEYVEAFAMPVSGKVIIIDAGHGGWDRGAYS